MREKADGTEALESKYTMAGLGPGHIPFGYGKHAWCLLLLSIRVSVWLSGMHSPGRFLAAMELKTVLAYVSVTYDIRAETEGISAPRALTPTACTMTVQFRRRQV